MKILIDMSLFLLSVTLLHGLGVGLHWILVVEPIHAISLEQVKSTDVIFEAAKKGLLSEWICFMTQFRSRMNFSTT